MKKIFLSLMVVLVVLATSVHGADFKAYDSPVDAEIIAEKAFVRSDHENRSKRLVSLEEGDVVSLMGEWDGGDAYPWYAVMIKAETGWIYGQNIQRLDGKPMTAAASPPATGVPTAQGQKSAPEPGVLATDGDYVTVVARGQGTDRAKALEQAWIEAVRLAVGATISSKSELNNDEFAENTIAHSRGVIESFDIVDEKNDGKRATVTIQAKVHKEILTDAAKVYAEAHTVKADAGGAIKAQLDVKAKDTTAEAKQKSGVELLKEVLDSYGPEMFYSATLDPKIKFNKETKRAYIQVIQKFNQDLFWQEFIPRLHKALEGIATKKEKRFYEDSVRKANQQLAKEGFALWRGVFYQSESDWTGNYLPNIKDAKFSDKFVAFGDRNVVGSYMSQFNMAPFSWYKKGVDDGWISYPTGSFIITLNNTNKAEPRALKAVIPENHTSYILYDLPCSLSLDNNRNFKPSNPALLSIFSDYENTMSANVVLTITYLDQGEEEIHTQLLRMGSIKPTIYRKFYFTFNRPEYDQIIQVFTIAPGYVDGTGRHLFLGSSNYNQKYGVGWYVELDESDLEKVDSMKLEVVFENQ
jgi:hypothetical protein